MIGEGGEKMGNEEMILDVITRAREALHGAQSDADKTPRPANACPAHDSQFALTKAQTQAMDTLLLMAQQNMKGGVLGGKVCTFLEYITRPWPCVFLSFAVFSPNFPLIVETAKGFMSK